MLMMSPLRACGIYVEIDLKHLEKVRIVRCMVICDSMVLGITVDSDHNQSMSSRQQVTS